MQVPVPRSVDGVEGLASAVSVAGGVAAGSGAGVGDVDGSASWLLLMGWFVLVLLPPKLVLLQPTA